jgi:hypothetical protein
VTLSAPTDMANGITKSYEIQAQCLLDEAPYAAPDRDPSQTTTTLPPTYSTFRYFFRSLYVTGFGNADAASTVSATDETTTTTSSSTTTTQPLAIPTTTALSSANLQAQSVATDPVPTERTDTKQRADAIRAELEAKGMDTSSLSDHEVLLAAPVAATRPAPEPDGGMPWWTFVLVTVLAAGAVVAYGAKRGGSSL